MINLLIKILNDLKQVVLFFLALIFFSTNTVYANDLKDFKDAVNNIQKKFDALPESNLKEDLIIDAAIKEIDKAVSFADLSYSIGDVESTISTLEYINKSLSDVSKIVPKENFNDMSGVDIQKMDKITSENIIKITTAMKIKNDTASTELVKKMLEINKKGFDPFIVSKNLNNIGIETLGFEEIAKALNSGVTLGVNPNKEKAYWYTIYNKAYNDANWQTTKSDEDIRKDFEAALMGGIDEKIHLTSKYMRGMGATEDEIQREIEALKAIETGKLDEGLYYTEKYMRSYGYTDEQIQKEISALKDIKTGKLDANVYYTEKYMRAVKEADWSGSITEEDIQKEISALKDIKAGKLDANVYYTEKYMRAAKEADWSGSITDKDIDNEVKALKYIKEGKLDEGYYLEQKYKKSADAADWQNTGSTGVDPNDMLEALDAAEDATKAAKTAQAAADQAKQAAADAVGTASEAASQAASEAAQEIAAVVKEASQEAAKVAEEVTEDPTAGMSSAEEVEYLYQKHKKKMKSVNWQ